MIRKLSYRTVVIAMVSALVLVPIACGKKGPLERPVVSTVNGGMQTGVTVESTLVPSVIQHL